MMSIIFTRNFFGIFSHLFLTMNEIFIIMRKKKLKFFSLDLMPKTELRKYGNISQNYLIEV